MDIDKDKKQRLERKGWKVSSVADFLNLSAEENSIIETRIACQSDLKKQCLEANLISNKADKKRQLSMRRSVTAKSNVL